MQASARPSHSSAEVQAPPVGTRFRQVPPEQPPCTQPESSKQLAPSPIGGGSMVGSGPEEGPQVPRQQASLPLQFLRQSLPPHSRSSTHAPPSGSVPAKTV